MMGLREVKKQQVLEAIRTAAAELFRERGIAATRVRDIIDWVEISEASFFNYFSSKPALVSDWIEELFDAGFREILTQPVGGSVRRQVRELVRKLSVRVASDRELLAEAWERAGRSPALASPSGAAARLLESGQAREEVRSDLPADQLAELLRAVLEHTTGAWLRGPQQGPETLEARLRVAADVLLDGCRKRNQRVRAPAPLPMSPSP